MLIRERGSIKHNEIKIHEYIYQHTFASWLSTARDRQNVPYLLLLLILHSLQRIQFQVPTYSKQKYKLSGDGM